MFLRFVKLNVQIDLMPDLRRHYETHITSQLGQTPGCLFAALVQDSVHPHECVSFTIWESPEAAAQYEQSGLFQTLLDSVQPFILDSDEWRVRLSDDFTLVYEPVSEPPEIEAFSISAGSQGERLPGLSPDNLYLRIVSAQTQPGKLEALEKVYADQIIPTLNTVEGCRCAFLAPGVAGDGRILSVTVWDSEAKAAAYDKSGVYETLLAKAKPFLSDLYQWKMALTPGKREKTTTSADLSISGYQVVTSDSFSTVAAH